jgi:hypothetical protein
VTDSKAWRPRTEDQLRRAAETGLLAEGQKLDLKREMPTNTDLAKDIAAFSLYGGTIIIGVDEKPPPAPPELHAVELDGLSERISQIAATRVDEAVIVTTTAIDSSTEPGKGYSGHANCSRPHHIWCQPPVQDPVKCHAMGVKVTGTHV